MARNVKQIANTLGAVIKEPVPDTGGGAFGMARLAEIIAARLQPSVGVRPGRPSDPSWTLHAKVPMSERTKERLKVLSTRLSTSERKVSPMQVAAQLLEDSLSHY